jgi:hypothetical protein
VITKLDRLGRDMYDELGDDGKRKCIVAQIAAEYSVGRPTIYRYLYLTRRSAM